MWQQYFDPCRTKSTFPCGNSRTNKFLSQRRCSLGPTSFVTRLHTTKLRLALSDISRYCPDYHIHACVRRLTSRDLLFAIPDNSLMDRPLVPPCRPAGFIQATHEQVDCSLWTIDRRRQVLHQLFRNNERLIEVRESL